jgi:hypothetical protein
MVKIANLGQETITGVSIVSEKLNETEVKILRRKSGLEGNQPSAIGAYEVCMVICCIRYVLKISSTLCLYTFQGKRE